MEKKYDIVALGEVLIDFTSYGKSEQGNTILEACPGGAPCNMLAMATKMGKKTGFIGKVGDDQLGKILKQTIDEIGIDSHGLIFDRKNKTTLAFVHTFPDGEREFTFYRNPSADVMLTIEEVDFTMIKDTKVFHFGTLTMTNEPVRTATIEAIKIAKEFGAMVSFDPNLRPPLWNNINEAKRWMEYGLSVCDILKISDNEVQFITGIDDYDEAINAIQKNYHIPLILLTLGKNGSCAYYNTAKVEVKGYKVNTIETTGAGDTFCGSSISRVMDVGIGNLNEQTLIEILRFSNGAAALVTTKNGALKSMPDVAEVCELINGVK